MYIYIHICIYTSGTLEAAAEHFHTPPGSVPTPSCYTGTYEILKSQLDFSNWLCKMTTDLTFENFRHTAACPRLAITNVHVKF